MKFHITKYNTRFSKSYTINLREFGLGEISISQHHKLSGIEGEWEEPTVNWCACGSKPVEDAVIFTDALTIAKHLCDCLAKDEIPTVTITES